jgi:hypothetical protein
VTRRSDDRGVNKTAYSTVLIHDTGFQVADGQQRHVTSITRRALERGTAAVGSYTTAGRR